MTANTNGERGGDIDLRSARRATGLSQQQLAERAKCSIAMVALLERGMRPDRSAVLGRIIAVLDDERPAGEPGVRNTTAVAAGRDVVVPD